MTENQHAPDIVESKDPAAARRLSDSSISGVIIKGGIAEITDSARIALAFLIQQKHLTNQFGVTVDLEGQTEETITKAIQKAWKSKIKSALQFAAPPAALRANCEETEKELEAKWKSAIAELCTWFSQFDERVIREALIVYQQTPEAGRFYSSVTDEKPALSQPVAHVHGDAVFATSIFAVEKDIAGLKIHTDGLTIGTIAYGQGRFLSGGKTLRENSGASSGFWKDLKRGAIPTEAGDIMIAKGYHYPQAGDQKTNAYALYHRTITEEEWQAALANNTGLPPKSFTRIFRLGVLRCD